MKHLVFFLPMLLLSACTSINVVPVPASHPIKEVVIRHNPAVEVNDFVPVLQAAFSRHHISSQVVPGHYDMPGKYIVTYTALRSWDIVPYLSKAEIYIDKDGRSIARAEYHLVGKGGLSPSKFAGTKTKIDPVMDALLKECRR